MKELFLREIMDKLGGKFTAALLIMLAAFMVSLTMMNQEYSSRLENYNNSLSLPAKDLFFDNYWFWIREDGSKDESNTVTFPMGKVRRPEPLLFFSRGTDKITRQAVEFISKFPIIEPMIRPEQEANLLKLLFSAPDFLLVVKVLVSLLAILFGYTLVCKEREDGTLKLVLAASASRTSVFIGKYLGGLFSVWMAFTIAFLAYLLFLISFTPVDFSGEIPVRIGLIYLAGLLFISVFFSIGVVVSVFNRSSQSALILSLFFWLFLVFLLPGLASLTAQQFIPVESKDKLARTKLETAQALEREYERTHPENTNYGSTAGYGRVHYAIRELMFEELAKIDEEYLRKKEVQVELTTNLARISPVGSMTYLVSGLSLNGIEDSKQFRRDLEKIKTEITEAIVNGMRTPEIARDFNPDSWDMGQNAKNFVKGVCDLVHRYEFDRLSLGETLQATWIDYLLLFLSSIILLVVSYVRFLVYDPR